MTISRKSATTNAAGSPKVSTSYSRGSFLKDLRKVSRPDAKRGRAKS
jgi:hypothetical protein